MKNASYLFYLLSFIFVVSCTSVASDEGTDSSGQTDISVKNQASSDKESTWEGFWTKFQTAVANDDKSKVAELTKFDHHISKEFFDENYDIYFAEEMKKIIASTKSEDVPTIEDGVEFPEGRTIAYEELGEDEEGNEIGSALILYFGKDKEAFKLMMFFAAG